MSLLVSADAKSMPLAVHVFGLGTRLLEHPAGFQVRFQHLPVPFELYSDGIDLPVFEEFGAGTAALHLRDQLERNELLADKEYRRRFRRQFDRLKLGPSLWHRDFHDAVIVECPDKSLIGKSFGAIADERGLHPLDAFLDVLVENGERNVRWTTIVANHRPKQLNKLAAEPSIHMGFSDAGAHLRNMAFYNFSLRLLKRTLDAQRDGAPFLSIERAVHRLTGEVADWFGLDAGTLREGDRADFVVIDPAGLDDSVDGYHEEEVPFYGGLRRMVNRNDAAVVATGVNGAIVFRDGQFRDGYGKTVKSGRYLRALRVNCSPPARVRRSEMARTQQQRREETVARLLEASIATIVEVGYARASAAVITKRAGVSVGALFRHFDTMGDFMAATAYEVLRRQLDSFTKRVAEIPSDRPALEAALTILRDITSSSTNAVLYELMIAARTDEKLNATLQHVLEQYGDEDLRRRARTARCRELPDGNLPGPGGAVDQHLRRSRLGGRGAATTGHRAATDSAVVVAAERSWPTGLSVLPVGEFADGVVQRPAQAHHLVDPQQGERPVRRRPVGNHAERGGVTKGVAGFHQHADPGRAEKLDFGQVDDQAVRFFGKRGIERLGQPRGGEHVHAAAHRYHRPAHRPTTRGR